MSNVDGSNLYRALQAANDSIDPVDSLGVYNMTLASVSSGNRLLLTGSYFEQCTMLNKPEVPRMYTGFEKQLGSYNDSLKIAQTDYVILHKVEKYNMNIGYHYLLVLQDVHTGIISCHMNRHYESLAEEHGYIKPMIDTDYKNRGDTIPKGAVITRSNSIDENLNYRYGVNANVAYISDPNNIEDGFRVNEDFAARTTYSKIDKIELTLGFGDVLLNMYGNESVYKCFPDIFGHVKDGIFCVKRAIDKNNIGCSTTISALSNINTNDQIIKGDGVLLDIEIFVNSNEELLKDNVHRQQIVQYYNIVRDFKYEVMKTLEPYATNNKKYRVTTDVNTIYSNYKDYIDATNSPTNEIRYQNSTGTFEFVNIVFTVGRAESIGEGSKIANRHGNKGVICKLTPAKYMPVDKYGNVVDILINPYSIPGRSNPGQNYEQELLFIADRVVDQMKAMDNYGNRFKHMMKYMEIVDKDNATFIESMYKSLDTRSKHLFIDQVMKDGIYVRQHPFYGAKERELESLYNLFNVRPDKLKVTIPIDVNGVIEDRQYETENSIIIAKQYIMVLKHTDEGKFSSTAASYTNTMGLPHKGNRKIDVPYRETPIKLGEMEINVLVNRADVGVVNRFLAAGGANFYHRDRVANMLLKSDPFQYHDIDIENAEIMNNIGSDALVAILFQMGYSIYSDTVEKKVYIGRKP